MIDFYEIKNKIFNVLISYMDNKDETTKQLLCMYTSDILKLFEINSNANKSKEAMLNMSTIPDCCKHCEKYKEHEMNVCDCILPMIDAMSNFISDENKIKFMNIINGDKDV